MTSKSPVGEKTELELLREQVETLTKLVLQATASQQEQKPKKEKIVRIAKQEKSREIRPDTYIKVMSLVPNPLNLNTRPRGAGKPFRFEKYGDVKEMFYSELRDVIETHPNFFEKGYFYILDDDVIKKNNYVELYKTLLTKEMIDSVVNNSSNAVQLFELAGEGQKDIIVNFFIEKINSGQFVDFNLIANINRIGKVDIQKMAADRKEAMNMIENKNENK